MCQMTQKHLKPKKLGKKSRQNIKRREINEEMSKDEGVQDSSNQSLEDNDALAPHNLILKDFLLVKPCSETRSSPDSDDLFIIFDGEGNEIHSNNKSSESPWHKSRIPSSCESEDSFIVFDRADLQSLDEDDDVSFLSQSSDLEDSDCDEIDSSFSIVNPKKVRFASPDKLCEVHPMIKWAYAYQAARKGPWEVYARDRCRFRERALRIERDIKHIFDPQHRKRIYRERFERLSGN